MAKAKKLPSGSWRVRVYAGRENGKNVYKSFTADTKKAAEYAAAQYAIDRKESTDPGRLTVARAVLSYIENKDNILSPSTIRNYRSDAANMFPSIQGVEVRNLTKALVQSAVSREAAGHSPKTVRNRYALLCAALREAGQEPPSILLPQKQRQEISIPDDAAVSALMEHVAGTIMHIPIALAAYMGLRRSEIAGLRWTDYDAATGLLAVRRAVVRAEGNSWAEKAPKTLAGARTLPVPDAVRRLLDEARKPDGSITGLSPAQISRRWDYISPKFGNVRFHDLRHYYASVMLALGVPDKYAMERMGHSTPNMLKAVYQHTMSDKQQAITDAINAYFGPK